MKNVKVVIGSGYGDEGKGLMTDYFCQNDPDNTLVVRFNGGSQASHTVVRDGDRHAFQHFGSGTFLGCATYLSKFFIVNPMTFRSEWSELRKMGYHPYVLVDEKCIMTCFYDVVFNVAVEFSRGNDKHGSCGLGINETVTRNGNPRFAFDVRWIQEHGFDLLREHLNKIKNYYADDRVAELGLDMNDNHACLLKSSQALNRYIEDVRFFFDNVKVVTKKDDPLKNFDNVVFEGAQGLQLDQDYGQFPHVTRSNTGMKNVREIIGSKYHPESIEVCYVTRAYQTRHGAGPFDGESKHMKYILVNDPTNVPNPHQGSMRYAPLNITKLITAVIYDKTAYKLSMNSCKIKYSLAVSCMDQITSGGAIITVDQSDHVVENDKLEPLFQNVSKFIGFSGLYLSYGPSAETMKVAS